MLDATFVTPGSGCPKCGRGFDRATSVEGSRGPEPGDITICIECVAVCRSDDALSVVEMPEGDLERLPIEQYAELQHVRSLMLLCKRGETP